MTKAKRAARKNSPKTPRRPTTKRKQPECGVEITETDIYLVYDGVRIAKRGKPGTPQAKSWVPLEPAFKVFNTTDLSEIVVVCDEAGIH
jgi:hypothetical protein